MPKKVSDDQKQKILDSFKNGINIKEISEIFDFTVPTITRQLKNILGEKEFSKIKNSKNIFNHQKESQDNKNTNNNKTKEIDENYKKSENLASNIEDKFFSNNFYEIAPLDYQIDLEKQKNITSKPLEKFNLPDVVFLVVDKNVELEPKFLKEYPQWDFLPVEDLNKLTLEIFSENKTAKKFCSQNQKIIKINNPKVFMIASEILKEKGISTLIYEDNLLSL